MTAHLAQGDTLPSALVELNLPPSGDQSATYVALSRVRHRDDLYILREFDVSNLRRKGSKAGADILLQRLRADLRYAEEGSKQCHGCKEHKKRSAFVSAVTKCTRQWLSRMPYCTAPCPGSPRLPPLPALSPCVGVPPATMPDSRGACREQWGRAGTHPSDKMEL
eukprot:gene57590-biopygen62549